MEFYFKNWHLIQFLENLSMSGTTGISKYTFSTVNFMRAKYSQWFPKNLAFELKHGKCKMDGTIKLKTQCGSEITH